MRTPHGPAGGEADRLPLLLAASLSQEQVPPLGTGPDNESPCQTSREEHSYPSWPTQSAGSLHTPIPAQTSRAWGMHCRRHVLVPTSQWERRLVGVIVVLLHEALLQNNYQQVNHSLG